MSGWILRSPGSFGFSRSRAADLVEHGHVLVDGASAVKSDRLRPGSWLDVELPPPPGPLEVTPESVEGMTVVHDDPDVVVVDKPVGVAAHPSPGWTGPTVIGGLAAAGFTVSTSGVAERQGVVHRLDVGTSGLMVIAKSERAYTALKRQFRDRTVDKIYHAVVQGHPDPTRGTIEAPIDRHPTRDHRWAVVAGGRPSITHYDTLEAFPAASLLEVRLETGRTHQIRVHLSALRHPCVGDRPTAPTRCSPSSWGWTGSGCTPFASASSTPVPASEWCSHRLTRQTSSTRSTCWPIRNPVDHAKWRLSERFGPAVRR